jgi:hypothetical protein
MRVGNTLKKLGVYDEFDGWMRDEERYDENERYEEEIRPLVLTGNKKIVEEEVDEEDDSIGFKNNKENLMDLFRSATSTPEARSTKHYTKNKNFEESRISNVKIYQITYFINAIYKNCKSHGIKPTIIIEWIEDLFYFYSVLSGQSTKEEIINHHCYREQDFINTNEKSIQKEELLDDEINNEIPLVSRISFFIEQKKKEIHQLVSKRNTTIEEINSLNEQKKKVQSNLSNTIEEEKRTFSYFQWYNTLKQELRDKFNIVIEQEFEAFARAINDFRDYDNNALQIVTEYKDFVSLREQRSFLKEEMDSINQTKQYLLNDISQLEDQANSYRQTMKTFYQLQQIGFGLPKLKELNGLITEVSAANSIDPSEAVTRFFKELERNYDTKFGLESKIKEMQNEYEQLKTKVAENQRYLVLQNPVAPNLAFLYSHGLTNDDITGITDLILSLNNSYLLDYKSIKKDNTIYINTNNNYNDMIDKKEFWKLIVEKFKDLNSINSEIEELRYYLKELETMKELDKQGDSLV